MFKLAKWYLDLVTDDGTALVGYAAGLRWGALRLRYASLLLAPPGQAPVEQTTLRQVAEPALDGNVLTWRSGPLHLEGRWLREARAIEAPLADLPTGAIHWHCLMPSAVAVVRVGEQRLTGRGYAERLVLTLQPNELPFRTLHWGRYLSVRHAVVWIDWSGAGAPARWIWLDGTLRPDARLDAQGITGLGPGMALRFGPPRPLRDRTVLPDLARPIPGLLRRVVGPVAQMRERKRLAMSRLERDGTTVDEGWAIHEEVAW